MDKIKSIRVQKIPDGYYKIGYIDGIDSFLYFGEGAKIKFITEPKVTNSLESIISLASSLNVELKGGTKTLSGINSSGTSYFVNNTQYYEYNEEYIELPSTKNPPKGKIVYSKTQISQNGFTLNGDPIVTGRSKGMIKTETFLEMDGYNVNAPSGNFITNISKSNPRYINGELYFNYTVTIQEI